MKGKRGPLTSAPRGPHTTPRTTTYSGGDQIAEDKVTPPDKSHIKAYKRGGKVKGASAAKRLDKRAR